MAARGTLSGVIPEKKGNRGQVMSWSEIKPTSLPSLYFTSLNLALNLSPNVIRQDLNTTQTLIPSLNVSLS